MEIGSDVEAGKVCMGFVWPHFFRTLPRLNSLTDVHKFGLNTEIYTRDVMCPFLYSLIVFFFHFHFETPDLFTVL